MADLPTSICAVLLAEACNIGLEPLVRPDVPALARGRLSWVPTADGEVRRHHILSVRADQVTRNGKTVRFIAQSCHCAYRSASGPYRGPAPY